MDFLYKINSKLFTIFTIILIFILFEGLLCRPTQGIATYTPYIFCNKFFFKNFWYENGFVENLQSIFLILSIFFLIKARKSYKTNKIINYFLIIHIICLIYYLGEEISWGQHFFNWKSPDFFDSINNQKETNLHNISNIFDQLPRSIVLLWCTLTVPIILFLNNFFNFNKDIIKILSPSKSLIKISILLLFFVIPDFIVDKLNLHPGHVDENGIPIEGSYLYDIFTFNFIRLSELHELIFTFYFLSYSLAMNRIRY
tara:strand:- start:21 stop:788 length:768 start_codon:yes stop_codon:yes gene_type:complete